jgi:hypothetical protein
MGVAGAFICSRMAGGVEDGWVGSVRVLGRLFLFCLVVFSSRFSKTRQAGNEKPWWYRTQQWLVVVVVVVVGSGKSRGSARDVNS